MTRPSLDSVSPGSVRGSGPVGGPGGGVRSVSSYSSARGWTAVAWGIAVAGWATAAAGVAAVIASGDVPGEAASWVMDGVTALVYGVVVTMMLPRSRHPVVWLLALTAVGCGVAGFATGYMMLGEGWPKLDVVFYLQFWAWVPGVYATVTVVPLLAMPRSPGTGRPWWLLLPAVVAIVLATLPGLTVVAPGLPTNPFGIDVAWWQSSLRSLGMWPDRAVAALGVAVGLWLLRRLVSAPPAARGGLRWLLAGHSAMVLAILAFVLPVPAAWTETAYEVSGTLLLVAQLFLPAALLVLVLGHQLWGIETRVDRSVVWSILTVSIAAANLVLLALVAQTLPIDSDVAVALTVGLVGLGATVVRGRVQRSVDQLIYGTGADPARLLSGIEQGDFNVEALARALSQGLRLSEVRIVAEAEADLSPAEGGIVIPLVSRGRPVGRLVASPRPGERLDRRTTRMLAEVAGLVAMTIELMQSVEALTVARSRLVSIRHEERRTLRRDLHDGLGPALAGLRLGLRAARGHDQHDPQAAAAMFDTVERELARQGEEVRRLSRSLVPLALDDGDLGAALETLETRFGGDGLHVAVSVAPGLDLAVDVQVALYQMANEALLNVQRHAGAVHCWVVVRRRADGDVIFSVSDDGCGIVQGQAEGIGLRSMRERAEELGGTLRISDLGSQGSAESAGRSSPASQGDSRGTRVELRLPAS